MLEQILIPTALLGGMGVLFGAGLAYAGKKLAVPQDERIDKVRACLIARLPGDEEMLHCVKGI